MPRKKGLDRKKDLIGAFQQLTVVEGMRDRVSKDLAHVHEQIVAGEAEGNDMKRYRRFAEAEKQRLVAFDRLIARQREELGLSPARVVEPAVAQHLDDIGLGNLNSNMEHNLQ